MDREFPSVPFFMRRSLTLTIWRWVFNLSVFGIFVTIFFNRFDLRIRIYFAGDSSLLNNFWLLVTAVILILFLTSTIHEFGHLLAGRFAQLKFQLLVIGPLRITRSKDGYSFEWQFGNALFNGLAASIPEEMTNLRRRMLLFAAGGPIASFLQMCVAAVLTYLLNTNEIVLRNYLWAWECALFVAIVSCFFFLMSMKPGNYQNGLPADGSRILMLLQNGAEAERWIALVALNSADIHGIRPYAWDESLLQTAAYLEDHSYDYLMLQMMQYQAFFDKGQPTQAYAILDRIIQMQIAWESGLRAFLALEMAYYFGRYQKDVKQAEEWLNQVKQNRSQQAIQFRAETAVYFAQNNPIATIAHAQKTIQKLDTQLATGVVLAEKAWMEEMIKFANEINMP